jgi:hypothetical protein
MVLVAVVMVITGVGVFFGSVGGLVGSGAGPPLWT